MNDKINLLNPDSTDFCTLDYECSYLPDRKVRMNYKHINNASKTFSSAVIQRGWRRFGKYFFHPICHGCNECKSIRIDASNYKLSKSQKKAIKRNKNTQIIVQKPSITKDHVALYNKYHLWKAQKDSWSHRDISNDEYFENFVDGANDFGKEVLYIVDDKLVGVDLIDILDDGISSIYFFYDPEYAHLSLGIYSLIYQINLAKILELRWIYLGYWVDGCKAFAYKTNFKPQQLLDGFPHITQDANWQEWDGTTLPKSLSTPLEK